MTPLADNFCRSILQKHCVQRGFDCTRYSEGMTILELVAVVAIISILAGISIPSIGNIISSSKIDEVKALLNTAAADCLQKSRLNDNDKDLIDDAIISDMRLNPIGFKIDKSNDADKCSYFQLVPIDDNDNIRFPIGFSVTDGVLSKFANPTSTNKSSINSCETWAGVNCKQDESLKNLINWKLSIAAEKTVCEEKYTEWLTVLNTTPVRFQRWNPNAEAGCPARPPKDGTESYKTSNTCTPNGCNKVVYGLEGEFVGFNKEDYDRALAEKYGKACSEWAAQKGADKYTNNPVNAPQTLSPECGNQEFWFFEGTDMGSEENLTTRLLKQASDKCEADREEARTSGFEGQWGPKEGPGACKEESYICNKVIVSESEYYQHCGEPPPEKCKTWLGAEDQECTDYELNEYLYKKCGGRPKDPEPLNCKYVGMGKPSDAEGWDKTPQCGSWARCMKLY